MCGPENTAKRDVLQWRSAANLAKRVVWRICAAENIAFRDESARAQSAQAAAQAQPALQQKRSRKPPERSRKRPQAAEALEDTVSVKKN